MEARIGGSHGHLSNRAAAELARELYHDELCAVDLAPLSENASHPALAHDVVGDALERLGYAGSLTVAPQERVLEPIDVSHRRQLRLPAQMTLF